ncbi:hypothetical protein NQ317_017141 [Molorchus minor]|uniref:Uncharacterized protein n=1 Tax=Molorchus minor TaxID=1323400 RepID=A0ABQ9JDK8_9CUCU|nr:hypothetical protein NQ317_017141 [Molorchus minor]
MYDGTFTCFVTALFDVLLLFISGIAHHLASLPGPPPEWALLGGRHPYPHAPFMPHHNPHFPHHMFAALDRPLNTSPRIANDPSSTSLGPISISCSSAHSTTSPKTSPNTQVGLLTTARDLHSPEEDDISVTASPIPSPQPPPAFPGVPPPPLQNNQLFNNALAAKEDTQNPDSSSEKLDVTEIDEDVKDVKKSKEEFRVKSNDCAKEDSEQEKSFNESLNLSLRVRKAAISYGRQKEEVSSSDNDNNLRCSRDSNRHVWRPY